MFDTLRDALDKYGEIMIRMDSGAEHELHTHNVTFKEDGTVKVDADDETHWFNAEKVERYWIHRDF